MMTAIIRKQLHNCLVRTDYPEFGSPYHGKVRDTYLAGGDRLILVTTDRISAFDHVLGQPIPFKGQVLNQLAAFFFRETAHLVPNHVLSVPDPNVTIAIRCNPFPVEFVVRGYLAGHAWREYRLGKRMLCGQSLPEGLRQNSRLETPILTPSTKAVEGHDEDISRADIILRGLIEEVTYNELEELALTLFARGSAMAEARGLILVDTKYEFGRTPQGDLVVIDEVHTPDSSRYFYAEGYHDRLARDEPQRQLSKEFVREWLMANGFQGQKGQRMPDLTDDFRVEAAERYIELYETMTGERFEPDTHPHPEQRILENIRAALA